MKRIVSLLIALLLVVTALAACNKNNNDGATTPNATTPDNTPVEKTYTLAIAVDSAVSAKNKVTNTALVLVLDEAGKIAAVRIDCSEVTPALNEDGTVKTVDSVATKVELGDAYTGMAAGSWQKQTKAYEDYIVGKTPAEVAALDTSLIAGCTMASSVPTFQALVAKAAASTQKVTFKTGEAITAGVAISTAVTAKKVTADFAGIIMAGGKVVASMIDSCEQSFTVAEGAITFGTVAVSKNEQGEAYSGMPAGPWYKQAQAFANSAVGKTAAELENLETVSDALAAAGCTMQNTTTGYKATIIKAAANAR